MTDSDDESPIPHEPLKTYAKSQTPEMYDGEEMWASDETIENLDSKLRELAQILWKNAAEKRAKSGMRTVQPEDIDEAFDELMYSHGLLKEAANEMQRLQWEFEDTAEKSPAIERMSNRDRDE